MKTLPEVTLDREQKAWELRLNSWTQQRIALELGISQSAVSQILKRLLERYMYENLEEIECFKAEQIAQLENVAFEAMQAWERSKIKNGDVRCLAIALKAKEDIRKILGIDSPSKLKTPERYKEFENLSDEELIERLIQTLAPNEYQKTDAAQIAQLEEVTNSTLNHN